MQSQILWSEARTAEPTLTFKALIGVMYIDEAECMWNINIKKENNNKSTMKLWLWTEQRLALAVSTNLKLIQQKTDIFTHDCIST